MQEAGFAPPLFHSDRVNDLFTTTLLLQYFPDGKSTKLPPKSTKLEGKSTKLVGKSTKSNGNDTELADKLELLSDELKSRIKSLRKKENGDIVQSLIEAICREVTMSTEELATLLDRNPKSLHRDHISTLLREKRLFLVNPLGKTDPKQAYTSRQE